MKIALGTFACKGVEAHLGADVAAGVRAAIADYTHRLATGRQPVDGIPKLFAESSPARPALTLDLPVDTGTWDVLAREAARQGTTVGRLAAHSVLVYLAELDRLEPVATA